MQQERTTVQQLITYLLDKGYPDNSIVRDIYIPGTAYQVDMAIIDPKTNLTMLLLMIISRDSDNEKKEAKQRLLQYRNLLPDKTVPSFIVIPSTNNKGFDAKSIDNSFISLDDYKSLKAATINRNAMVLEQIKKKTIDYCNVLSWVFAVIILALLVIKKLVVIELDVVDMTLIGGIVALAFFPFVSKVKFLGIELERITKVY